ncbi:hypothetical protein [Natrialba taiwanensis]|uniref:Uncharacterized protein n=1 Tax=Natrialba taiwanensis DSM 12281 TaxID=1230458 RepID=M0A473_9EURY|nr:hypothetical protein [Natrialba taiwanensis]ELY93131.1 hypothetical protein C484_07948 [Natrialba taiwanensis DSM 12281]
MTADDLDPDTVSGSDQALGVDDPTPDLVYDDQEYQSEGDAVDGEKVTTDGLHKALRKAERDLREIDEQLPDPLTLNDSLTELRATAAVYARLGPEHRNRGD